MITERVDERTGTIVFEEDEESKRIRYLLKKCKDLEERVQKLETLVSLLEKKEDSI